VLTRNLGSHEEATIERVFESLGCDGHRTLFRTDRDVAVYAHDALPSSGRRPANQVPLWVKAAGVRIEAHMLARQIAWVRRSDGGWMALVLVPATSSNRRLQIALPMCVDSSQISTDLTLIDPHERVSQGEFVSRSGVEFVWKTITSVHG
jgi:hypothetical protein